MVLAMSPIGDSFRNRTRMYPGLVNCTTIDWFQPWPADALVEVATKFIQDIPVSARGETPGVYGHHPAMFDKRYTVEGGAPFFFFFLMLLLTGGALFLFYMKNKSVYVTDDYCHRL